MAIYITSLKENVDTKENNIDNVVVLKNECLSLFFRIDFPMFRHACFVQCLVFKVMPMYNEIQKVDPKAYEIILWEEKRQSVGMEFIASENYQSKAVLAAQSSTLANKYAEWTPGKRYYGGQEYTDQIEQLAIERACWLFGSDHANVQALSWAAANICIYAGLLKPGDTVLWMDLTHGGHLTHGHPVTFMGKIFNFVRYGMKDATTGGIDFDHLRKLAKEHKPKIILAWFSAYPRELEYAKFTEIAEEVGAVMMADMSHIWWLIAAGVLANPFDAGFHVMMTTTHKSLRGPRGSLILSKWKVGNPLKKPENTIENIPTRLDRAVFPWVQGWPHMNTIAWIAVALHEASQPEFKAYAEQTLVNAKVMAESFLSKWYKLVTWWTDNHMIVVDFSGTWIDGRIAERALDEIGISTSKSTIPDDPNPPFKPSGLRIWTPAMTTRWLKGEQIKQVVDWMDTAFKMHDNPETLVKLMKEVENMSLAFPSPSV